MKLAWSLSESIRQTWMTWKWATKKDKIRTIQTYESKGEIAIVPTNARQAYIESSCISGSVFYLWP